MECSEELKFEGFLEKQSRSLLRLNNKSKWRKLWFVLNNYTLSYYKEDKKVLCGELDMSTVQTLRTLSKDSSGVPFEIVTRKREYVLRSDTPEDCQKWVKILRQSMQYKRLRLISQSSLNSDADVCKESKGAISMRDSIPEDRAEEEQEEEEGAPEPGYEDVSLMHKSTEYLKAAVPKSPGYKDVSLMHRSTEEVEAAESESPGYESVSLKAPGVKEEDGKTMALAENYDETDLYDTVGDPTSFKDTSNKSEAGSCDQRADGSKKGGAKAKDESASLQSLPSESETPIPRQQVPSSTDSDYGYATCGDIEKLNPNDSVKAHTDQVNESGKKKEPVAKTTDLLDEILSFIEESKNPDENLPKINRDTFEFDGFGELKDFLDKSQDESELYAMVRKRDKEGVSVNRLKNFLDDLED